jgi:hypothetical protein
MNDDQLKREIEEALSVEPSPEFAARVRTRIAENSRTSESWLRWSIAGAGLAAAAIMIVVVVSEPAETVTPQPVSIARVEPQLEKEVPAPPVPQPIRKAPKVTHPEILIDPREAVAFQKLIEGVWENRIDVTSLIERQPQFAGQVPIQEIALIPLDTLNPLVTEPLPPAARRPAGGNL